MHRPLIFPFLGLAFGIIIGNFFDLPYFFLPAFLIFIFVSLLVSIKKQWLFVSLLLLFGLTAILGIINIQKQEFFIRKDCHILQHVDSGKKTIEGIVIESPSSYPEKNILTVRCLRLINNETFYPVSGNVRLVVPADLNFSYGDFIRFKSSLKKIQSFKNPGAFDYEKYLNRQGIYATGFIADNSAIIRLRGYSASYLRQQLETFRIFLQQLIYQNAPSPQREIIEAMIIGNQTAIPPEIKDNFSKTGTSHILSISGLHVGMVAAMAFFACGLLLKSSEYLLLKFNMIKVSAMAALILVTFYALIAGMSVTVLRSALMALIFLLALMFGRQKDLYNTLALAGFVILMISPEALFDISFQLSFLAVLALIYIVPRFDNLRFAQFTNLPGWGQSIIRYLYTSIIVCLAATIGTLPIIVYYFNRVSTIAVIANLIAVPLLGTIALATSMFFLLAAFFSPAIAGFFIKITSFIVSISIEIINKLASLSFASFTFTKPNLPEIVIFYLFIFLLIQLVDVRKGAKGYFLQHRRQLKCLLLIIIAFFIADVTYLFYKDKLSSDLRVTAIDVGQGSAILVRFAGGKNMLIDGGGFAGSSFDTGKMVIAPYLYHERISKIDIVVLTHPHPDHMLGLLYILDNFDVQEFWTTEIQSDDEDYQKLMKILKERNIKVLLFPKNLAAHKSLNKCEINFLWPEPSGVNDDELSDMEFNDLSLVFQIKYGLISFLVTGDISAEVESVLLRSGYNLNSDVLFVPHHGSAYSSSSSFIKKVACRYAVISAGKNNSFHHPHPITIERYRAAHVNILRTDQDGAVTMNTDGTKLSVKVFVEHR